MSTESPVSPETPQLTDSQAALLLAQGNDKEFAAWLARQEAATGGDFLKLRELEIRTGIMYASAGRRAEAKRILRQANVAIQHELIAIQTYGSPDADRLERMGPQAADYIKTLKARLDDALRLEREMAG